MLVQFAAPNAKALAERIEGIVPSLKDWRPAFRAMLPGMAAGLAGNIRGSGFAPLTALYARRKARSGKGRAMLIRTGALIGELGSAVLTTAKLRQKSVGWGPSQKYAYVLHHGVPTLESGSPKQRSRRLRRRSQRLAGKLPPRPWLYWTERMEVDALEIAKAHVDAALAGRGAR
ncbi:MAG: Phage virion morphosis family [Gemmatimonadota bacterium]|jgi:hypothetical protein